MWSELLEKTVLSDSKSNYPDSWLNRTFWPISTHASYRALKLLPDIEPLLSK